MDALKTDLCELLGIEVPVVQAPIGSASCPALAAAVSEAGGLGTLALSGVMAPLWELCTARIRAAAAFPVGLTRKS